MSGLPDSGAKRAEWLEMELVREWIRTGRIVAKFQAHGTTIYRSYAKKEHIPMIETIDKTEYIYWTIVTEADF